MLIRRPTVLYLLLAAPALAAAGDRAAPRPHVDPEAMREASGPAPVASGRAISHYLASRRCQDQGDWRCAAAELQQAVADDDRNAELRAALSEALALSGQLPRAEAEARLAVELAGNQGPSASRGHVLLAQLVGPRDRERAVLELRQAVRLESAHAAGGRGLDAEPWRLLAVTYLELGDEPAAARTLDDLSARVPAESGPPRELGRWLLDRHQPGRAERYLRAAAKADPGDVRAWRLLARAHRELGLAPEVKADLEALLEAQPEDPEALVELGSAALRRADLPRARELLGRYQRCAGDRALAGLRAAGQWLEAGRPDDALEAARTALAEAGADPRLHLLEGTALQRLERWPEAERALRAAGEAADAEVFVPAWVALAEVLSRQGRHGEARRALTAPLARRPGDLRLIVAAALALERAGRAGEGAAELERAALAKERAAAHEEAVELRAARARLLTRARQVRRVSSGQDGARAVESHDGARIVEGQDRGEPGTARTVP